MKIPENHWIVNRSAGYYPRQLDRQLKGSKDLSYWQRLTEARVSRRRALQGAAAVGAGAAAIGIVGCGGGDGDGAKTIDDPTAIIYTWQLPDETRDAVRGGIRKDQSTADITGTLDPMVSPSFTTVDFMAVVYETLLRGTSGPGIDPNSVEGNTLRGRLAESFEIADAAQTFTLRMRPNVKFHDVAPVSGRVMDIDDWKTSYERYTSSSPFRTNLTEIVDKVEYPDNRTMVFRLKEPSVAFIRALSAARSSFLVLPKELNANPRIAETSAIGTNFRILDKIQPSIGREYRKHPGYWENDPFMERWLVPIIPEPASRRAQFITGNVFTYVPPQSDVLLLRQDYPAARMFKGDVGGNPTWYTFLGLREFETSPWRDERVRIAMRMSVDWDAVRAHFSNSNEFEAAGIPVESRMCTTFAGGGLFAPYWLDPKKNELGAVSKNYLYDVAEAKKLMSAAGHANGIDMDGYMNGGNEYGTAYYHESVQIISDEMAKSGLFRVRLQRPPYAEYLPRIYQQRDFKGASINHPEFVYTAEVDLNLFNWYHSKGARRKWIGDDQKLDDMIIQQRREADDKKRLAIIHDIQKYIGGVMLTIAGDGNSGGFGFRQPWVRNGAYPENFWWIAEDAPNRNTA
jgi:ABC-type transport system substrate-binding protein